MPFLKTILDSFYVSSIIQSTVLSQSPCGPLDIPREPEVEKTCNGGGSMACIEGSQGKKTANAILLMPENTPVTAISGNGTWTVGPQSKNKIIRGLWAKKLRNTGLNLQKYILSPKKTIIAYIKTILNKET